MLEFATMSFPALDGEPGAESEEARRRGYARGLAEGLKAGELAAAAAAERDRRAERQDLLEATTRLREAEAALSSAVVQLERRAAPTISGTEQLLLESAFRLAEAIVGVTVNRTEFGASAALARVISAADGTRLVRVRMNPDDLALLDDTGSVELFADPTLAPGDAVAETEFGSIDATIRGAFARARAALESAPGGSAEAAADSAATATGAESR